MERFMAVIRAAPQTSKLFAGYSGLFGGCFGIVGRLIGQINPMTTPINHAQKSTLALRLFGTFLFSPRNKRTETGGSAFFFVSPSGTCLSLHSESVLSCLSVGQVGKPALQLIANS